MLSLLWYSLFIERQLIINISSARETGKFVLVLYVQYVTGILHKQGTTWVFLHNKTINKCREKSYFIIIIYVERENILILFDVGGGGT